VHRRHASLMCLLACGYAHTVIIGRAGQVLTCGRGVAGQLGHGNTEPVFEFKEVQEPLLAQKRVIAVAAGLAHSLALTEFGSVFSWGAGAYGQLGDGNTTMSTLPNNVSGLLSGRRVKAIASGDAHCLCVTHEGTVFTWGRGSCGQLGSGAQADALSPIEIGGLLRGRRVRQIACGGDHSLALLEEGRVMAWGSASHGQIGIGTVDSYHLLPVEVAGLSRHSGALAKGIAAGQLHSLALTDTGKVYAWGNGHSGQLGQGGFGQLSPAPVQVKGHLEGVRVKLLAAGGDHSAAVIEKVRRRVKASMTK
jgi:alpha-tubulin suppressor-like RCC1 family protein